jgi:hypothetical protein
LILPETTAEMPLKRFCEVHNIPLASARLAINRNGWESEIRNVDRARVTYIPIQTQKAILASRKPKTALVIVDTTESETEGKKIEIFDHAETEQTETEQTETVVTPKQENQPNQLDITIDTPKEHTPYVFVPRSVVPKTEPPLAHSCYVDPAPSSVLPTPVQTETEIYIPTRQKQRLEAKKNVLAVAPSVGERSLFLFLILKTLSHLEHWFSCICAYIVHFLLLPDSACKVVNPNELRRIPVSRVEVWGPMKVKANKLKGNFYGMD